jgi:hypothetical protein
MTRNNIFPRMLATVLVMLLLTTISLAPPVRQEQGVCRTSRTGESGFKSLGQIADRQEIHIT